MIACMAPVLLGLMPCFTPALQSGTIFAVLELSKYQIK